MVAVKHRGGGVLLDALPVTLSVGGYATRLNLPLICPQRDDLVWLTI